MSAGSTLAEVARFVIAHIDTDDDVRRKADEPRILFVVGGAGLAGDRLADFLYHRRRAALYDAFHHRGDLIGRHRIQHLLPAIDKLGLGLVFPAAGGIAAPAFPRIVLEDRAAIAILKAVNKLPLPPRAAVGEH